MAEADRAEARRAGKRIALWLLVLVAPAMDVLILSGPRPFSIWHCIEVGFYLLLALHAARRLATDRPPRAEQPGGVKRLSL